MTGRGPGRERLSHAAGIGRFSRMTIASGGQTVSVCHFSSPKRQAGRDVRARAAVGGQVVVGRALGRFEAEGGARPGTPPRAVRRVRRVAVGDRR